VLTAGGSSTHLNTNSIQNTEDGTQREIIKRRKNFKKLRKKLVTKFGRAGRVPSFPVIPWNLPYN
jgi:hypothetical protein